MPRSTSASRWAPPKWARMTGLSCARRSYRLLVSAGYQVGTAAPIDRACRSADAGWGAHLGRAFLEAGADELLARAPTTPGIDSEVGIEWSADEDRLLTRLRFAGPLDIPNGTCWLDETLSVDEVRGAASVGVDRGLETSPFAESACGRFFDHLPDGGAGGQAVSLLPIEIPLAAGGTLRLLVSEVDVAEDGVRLGGTVERS